MPETNRISATITDTQVTDIKAAIATIRQNLPFLVTLTDAERQEKPKMGDKSIGFHDKVQAYMNSNPEFLPGFLVKAEIDKDQAARMQVITFLGDLKALARSVDDSLMEINSELWQADLAYYNNVRQGAHQGAANAQTIYNDLKPRFPGRGGSGGGTTPPAGT